MSKHMVDISLDTIEETIDKVDIKVKDIEAENIINRFKSGIEDIKQKFELLENTSVDKNIEEYIFRSQIAFLMGSVDFYIHEIIKYSILKMFNGEKVKTKKYHQFTIYIQTLEKAIANPESIDWLEEVVISVTKYKTYMKAKSIKEALELVSNKKIYKDVCKELDLTEKEVDNRVKEIFTRRNEIVHQTDIDMVTKEVNDINYEFVKESIDFIESLIINIHENIVNDIL